MSKFSLRIHALDSQFHVILIYGFLSRFLSFRNFWWIFVLLCMFWLVYNDFIDGANVEWISLQNLRHLMFMLFGKIIHYHVHLLFLSVESFMINQFKTPIIYIWLIITHCLDILEHFYWRFFYTSADSIHLTGLRTKC